VIIGVGDIKGAIPTDVVVNSGSILTSGTEIASGMIDQTGAVSASNQWFLTGYVPVKGGVEYETNISDGASVFLAYFDANQLFISTTGTQASFTPPVNAAYIRVNMKSNNLAPYYIRKSGGATGESFYIPNLLVPRQNVVELEDDGQGEEYPVEIIPYSTGTATTNGSLFGYADQSAIKGKYIDSIRLGVASANTITIVFASNNNGSGVVWSKTHNATAGINEIPVNRKLEPSEWLFFSGLWRHKSGGGNPVGGGIIGAASDANVDLCVGVTIMEKGKAPIPYMALGDSITYGYGATMPYPRLLSTAFAFSPFVNLAVSGIKAIGSTGLIAQVNQVPDNFAGLVTIMVGVNDAGSNTTLGDSATVLAKSFNTLNIDASFAEAFRLCLETLLRKAPNARVLVILPVWGGTSALQPASKLETYRQAERDICEYFAVPYSEIYKTCKICPLTSPALMP
ncbi:SGNH/GDSL hydrolase family protein, partial [Viscerimonas tarda]